MKITLDTSDLWKWAPHALCAVLFLVLTIGLYNVVYPDTGPRRFVEDGAACYPNSDAGQTCIEMLGEYEDNGQDFGVNRMIRAGVARFMREGTPVEAVDGRFGVVFIEYRGDYYLTLDRYLD